MKRHGNYALPTPEELALDLLTDNEQAANYVRKQLRRHVQKHRNDKRNKQKHKPSNK